MILARKKLCAAIFFSGALTIGAPAVLAQNNQSPIDQLKETNACVNCNLSGANLSGLDLYEVDLTGANLTNADFSSSKFYKADLTGANLTNADLSGAKIGGSNLTDANLTGATMPSSESDLIFCRTTRPDGMVDSKDCK